jgi:hypothetical protein
MKHDVKTDCGTVSSLHENEWFWSNARIGLTEWIRIQSGNENAISPTDDRWVSQTRTWQGQK